MSQIQNDQLLVDLTQEDDDNNSDDSVLVMIDISGVHRHRVRWCHCPSKDEPQWQLFKTGLFPATFKHPRSAFTFQVLDYFHIDQVECKTSANNFYSKLRRLTNNAFPDTVSVSLHILKAVFMDGDGGIALSDRTATESS
jgi:hypothetical protein